MPLVKNESFYINLRKQQLPAQILFFPTPVRANAERFEGCIQEGDRKLVKVNAIGMMSCSGASRLINIA